MNKMTATKHPDAMKAMKAKKQGKIKKRLVLWGNVEKDAPTTLVLEAGKAMLVNKPELKMLKLGTSKEPMGIRINTGDGHDPKTCPHCNYGTD